MATPSWCPAMLNTRLGDSAWGSDPSPKGFLSSSSSVCVGQGWARWVCARRQDFGSGTACAATSLPPCRSARLHPAWLQRCPNRSPVPQAQPGATNGAGAGKGAGKGPGKGPGKAASRVQRWLEGEGRRRRLRAPQADGTLDPVAMETALLSQMLLTLKSTQDGISPKITIRRSGF